MSEPVDSPSVRVIAADLPDRFYQSLTALISAERDMILVRRVTGRVELLLAVSDGDEVVVLGVPRRSPTPGICSHLLSEYSNLKILVLAEDTGALDAYWRGIRHRRLRSFSAQTLIRRIRELHQLNPTL